MNPDTLRYEDVIKVDSGIPARVGQQVGIRHDKLCLFKEHCDLLTVCPAVQIAHQDHMVVRLYKVAHKFDLLLSCLPAQGKMDQHQSQRIVLIPEMDNQGTSPRHYSGQVVFLDARGSIFA